MRNLAPRNAISNTLLNRLHEKTEKILSLPEGNERRQAAKRIYENSRTAKWFKPVIESLLESCLGIEVCMYCSSNEPSHIDHFRPRSVFPEFAMIYDNFLWSCSNCNGFKLNRFPPDTEKGEQIINPIDDNVWDYFTFDEFGGLAQGIACFFAALGSLPAWG